MIAYLDDDCWELADKIVEKMDQGRIHGKRTPTTFTFRFLHGCVSATEKKERLRAYLQENSTDGYKLPKKRSTHPQVRKLDSRSAVLMFYFNDVYNGVDKHQL